MASDIRRYDLPADHPFTPGELRSITMPIREEQTDGTFDPAASFAAYDNWQFWCMKSSSHKCKSYAELDTAAIFKCAVSDGITVLTPPNLNIEISAAKSALVTVTTAIAYEFWADYNGEPTRLAYGLFPWVN